MMSNNIDSKIVKPFTWLNVSFEGNEKLFLCVKQFSAKNLSSGCCGYKDGPGGCGLFSLTVGVYEDTMEVVCMRSEREKLHFMDFKQRIPVAAPSLNVSSGCEEMGEQENTEITKFKKSKTTK